MERCDNSGSPRGSEEGGRGREPPPPRPPDRLLPEPKQEETAPFPAPPEGMRAEQPDLSPSPTVQPQDNEDSKFALLSLEVRGNLKQQPLEGGLIPNNAFKCKVFYCLR